MQEFDWHGSPTRELERSFETAELASDEPLTGRSVLPIRGTRLSPPFILRTTPARKPWPQCWGFRLSLSSEILAGARRSAPPSFEMIALSVLG